MTETLHEHFMREALKQAKLALEKGEVPVGAIVVYNNQIIARAHNQNETLKDPTAHAEMIAMTQASAFLSENKKDHRGSLEGASLYVTLEPCPMCAGALVNARIARVVYGCDDPKAGALRSLFAIGTDTRLNHRFEVVAGVLATECARLLSEFFAALRRGSPG